ncbi:MAG: hypothetical protein KatS3mg118_0904 [Paracoccaceae bacterium]|nr:MAG: hypothetical protein KatS3mg118_0904 [Paracoccaceae bacterium]
MKALEWSVLTAMSAGLAVVVLLVIMPAADQLASQIGVGTCKASAMTPEPLRCMLERVAR